MKSLNATQTLWTNEDVFETLEKREEYGCFCFSIEIVKFFV